MKRRGYLIIFFLTAFLVGQDGPILPGQKSAIKSLKLNSGYSDADLDAHLLQSYGKTIDQLTRIEGAEVIRAIQAGSIAKKPKETTNKDLKIASILEPGMKKLFHLRDGTIRNGEILSIDDDLVVLKTASGTFNLSLIHI